MRHHVVIVLQEKKSNSKIYVLDASVFIKNLSYMFNDSLAITTPLIEDEIKSPQAKMDFYRASTTYLQVILPKKEHMEKVKQKLKETNHNLSISDISIIALALEFKEKGKDVEIVSDDYSVQDVASLFGISTISLTYPGITTNYKWKRVCTGCGRETNREICEICGSPTKYVKVKE